jgi:hypothetical protein
VSDEHSAFCRLDQDVLDRGVLAVQELPHPTDCAARAWCADGIQRICGMVDGVQVVEVEGGVRQSTAQVY